jgi:hypothetical protein
MRKKSLHDAETPPRFSIRALYIERGQFRAPSFVCEPSRVRLRTCQPRHKGPTMPIPSFSRPRPLSLNSEDKARLHEIAHRFGIEFRKFGDDEYLLRSVDGRNFDEFLLPSSIAHKRLLTEICSRCAPWVYFHFGESCQDSLLNHSDARLWRIAELYTRDLQGCPSTVRLVH